MMSLTPINVGPKVEPTKLKLAEGTNRADFEMKLENATKKGNLSRADFKTLADSVVGGKASLGEFLKTNKICTPGESEKLTDFFRRGDNSEIKATIDHSKLTRVLLESDTFEQVAAPKSAPKGNKVQDLPRVEGEVAVEAPKAKSITEGLNPKQIAKLERLLGTKLEVKHQSDMGQDLDKNDIKSVLHGLTTIPVASVSGDAKKALGEAKDLLVRANERIQELNPGQGKTLNVLIGKKDIETLLSGSPEDRKLGTDLVASMSKISKYPELISGALKGSAIQATKTGMGNGTVDTTQAQTSFIKYSRNLLTKSFFEAALPKDLDASITKLGTLAPEDKKKLLSPPKGEVLSEGIEKFNLPEKSINKYIANVGFNRLMSENNTLGASLSSDVDFKLVFDDVSFKADLLTANPELKPADLQAITNLVQKKMVDTMDGEGGTKKTFSDKFNLTLEVQSFTVKPLSKLSFEALTDKTEQNFLATVKNNHTFMSGEKDVSNKLIDIVNNNLTFPTDWKAQLKSPNPPKELLLKTVDLLLNEPKLLKAAGLEGLKETFKGLKAGGKMPEAFFAAVSTPEVTGKLKALASSEILGNHLGKKIDAYNKAGSIPIRNWDQNLGVSDKGSILAIKNLPKLEAVVNRSIDIIMEPTKDFVAKAKAEILHEMEGEANKEDKPVTDLLKGKNLDTMSSMQFEKLLLDNPILVKAAIHSKDIETAIVADPQIKEKLKAVPMFDGETDAKKLTLVTKLTSTFTKDDGNRNFIGRPAESMDMGKDWIFSVKYSGCRLNDMFDMVKPDEFEKTFKPVDVDKARTIYKDSKEAAGAINAFSIQVQNRIYEHYSGEGKSHDEMDKFYDRVNATEFADMIGNKEMQPKINSMLKSLVADLDKMPEGDLKTSLKTEITDLRSVMEESKNLDNHGTPAKMELGKKLFTSISEIARKTAEYAKPPTE